jgi:TadE-like protein
MKRLFYTKHSAQFAGIGRVGRRPSRVARGSGAGAIFCRPLARSALLSKGFIGDKAGIAITEFALVLPILLMLFFGAVDVTRYILITQKVEKLAHSVADVTAQSATITQATLNQVLDASTDIMNPYVMGVNGHIMVSSLYRPPGTSSLPTVSWRHVGGGTMPSVSRIGAVGSAPVMPITFAFAERENVIAAEVFYQFSPLLPNPWFGTTTVYRSAFYTPRFGALTSPPL